MERLRTRAFASRKSGILSALLLALVVAGLDSSDRMLTISSFVPGQPSPVSVRLPSTGYLKSSPTGRVKVRFEYESFILKRGELVPDRAAENYKLLERTMEQREQLLPYRLVGIFLVTFLLGYLLSEALRRSWPGNRRYLRTELSIFLLIGLLAVIAKPVFLLTALPVYIVPAASGPIVVSFYRGRRLGVYVSLYGAFILAAMLGLDPVAFLVFLVEGLSVIPFLKQTRKFKPVFMAAGVSTVAGLVTLFGLSLALTGPRDIVGVTEWRDSVLLAVLVGGIVSGPIAWILALSIRPLLGIVSQSKLNDLQALNHPLLKRLHEQAPGTWEHSRAIANIAEEAASKIEVDALLVRVGSYFHDLGKAINPHLFVENQEFDENGRPISPHDDMAPEKSAQLIIDHVTQGVQILRNNGIPEGVVEFAYMHHGSSVMEFFWKKYLAECKDKGIEKPQLTKASFTYPGLRPQSPETGIMMLADSVEAASRTVSEPTLDNFRRIVSRIVFTKLGEGQLDDCGLTIEDLKLVLQSFAESLHFSRHKRVKYQWQVKEEAEEKRLEMREDEPSQPSRPSSAPPEPESPSIPPPEPESGGDPLALPAQMPRSSEGEVDEVPAPPPVDPPPSVAPSPATEPSVRAAQEPAEKGGSKIRKSQTSTLTGIGSVDDKAGGDG